MAIKHKKYKNINYHIDDFGTDLKLIRLVKPEYQYKRCNDAKNS